MATVVYANHRSSGYYGYPQPPPSPPMDETSKCSLPSISNLLVMADAGSPTSEHPPHSHSVSSKPNTRPNSSHYSASGSSRVALPPTPPMSTDASFEGYSSPPSRPLTQAPAMPESASYYYETTPPVEEAHRQHMSPPAPRLTMQPQPYSPSSFTSSSSSPSTSASTSTSTSASSYPSHAPMPTYYAPPLPTGQPQVSNVFYSRPLSQPFSPLSASVSLPPASGANPWQHHHYISPSSAASFPQSQDRYICQTCNKAFSRPSSLRIHSHSHTGEKPFKCPHAGCGKAFSVRSNMKRHERGCHSFESNNCHLR